MTALERVRTGVLIGALSAALALGVATPAPAKTVGTNNLPITNAAGATFGVLSHRGGALQWPENSVEAYAGSVAAGFDTIETDIAFTADGQAVMSHYDTLPARCTQTGQAIHLMTAAQVAEVRCANLAGELVVPIPTFEQLANELAKNAEVGLTLDIKSYPGQPDAEQRLYAARAIQLVKDHGLLARTAILSFYWTNALPEIRKVAPTVYVLALDNGQMDLDRVRLADKLKANGYGIKMKYTSEYLARYIKAKGMDSVPWEVVGDEQLAFSIYYGGKLQLFSSDTPTTTRADLVAGKINLNPTPVTATTALPVPVALATAQKFRAGVRSYPVVVGTAVPKADVSQLRTVTLAVTVVKGKGRLYVGGMSTPLKSSVSTKLPKPGTTIAVNSVVGDKGKLRISTSRTVSLSIAVTGYTRVRFA